MITTFNEKQTLEDLNNMCISSLDPEAFQKWEDVKAQLKNNRRAFKTIPKTFTEKNKVIKDFLDRNGFGMAELEMYCDSKGFVVTPENELNS